MSEKTTLDTLHKKGMVSSSKVRTVEIGENDIVFIEVPGYRLPTLQQLGPTTFSIKLYPLD